MASHEKVTFIRKNGKVIPIKAKGSGGGGKTKNKKPSNSKKQHKQSDSLFKQAGKERDKSQRKKSLTQGIGLLAGAFLGRKKLGGGVIGGFLGLGVGSLVSKHLVTKNKKKSRELSERAFNLRQEAKGDTSI